MKVTGDELARAMFKARCENIGITEGAAVLISGEGYEQYLDLAGKFANWINDYEPEVLAIAKFLVDRHAVSEFFITDRGEI